MFDCTQELTNEETNHFARLIAGDGERTHAADAGAYSVNLKDVIEANTGDKWLNDKIIDLCFWALQQRDRLKVLTDNARDNGKKTAQCKSIEPRNLFFVSFLPPI